MDWHNVPVVCSFYTLHINDTKRYASCRSNAPECGTESGVTHSLGSIAPCAVHL